MLLVALKMVQEKNSTPKTFSRRNGVQKISSVPVGKRRRNLVSPGRNCSSSKSGSQNTTSHRKLLLRNNRDLARALSCEKERFRAVVTENVNLNARLHDARLSVHGLEKQLCESRESLKRGVMDHLRDAVKHSMSLTESLQLAIGLCYEEPKGLHYLRNTASSPCMPTSSHQPLKLRVNPMVAGLTIRHPTISLRRVVMKREDRVADGSTLIENLANDNVADDVIAEHDAADENVAPSEEESAETVEDISRNMEETRERPGGLSTCLEEDEEGVGNTEMDEKESDEEISSKKRGGKKKPLKESCPEASDYRRKLRSYIGRVKESSKEKSSNGVAECEAPVVNDLLSNNFTGPAEDYDVSDFDVGLKNCPMAKSTPLNHGKSSKNSKPTNLSVSKSASNSSNNSLVSDESCSSGNNQVKEVDKNLVVPVIDSKYVNVRRRKHNFQALSPVGSVNLPDLPSSDYVAGNMPEVQRCTELSDEIVNSLGFPASSESEEEIELMKTIIASECEPKSRESSRSCGLESIRSVGVTHDSQMFMASNCEESADNQGRPRRRAAPKDLKEMKLKKK